MKRTIILFACLTLALMTGCKKEKILTTDEMVDVLFDIYRFDATAAHIDYYIEGKEKVRYYNGIFAKHHTDKSGFDKSLEWYAGHPEQWRLVNKKLEEKSETFLTQVEQGQLPEFKAMGIAQPDNDTMNYWLSQDCMYWYNDLKDTIDKERILQDLEGKKYFIGAKKIELTLRMRCSSDEDITMPMQMTIGYADGSKNDTLSIKAQADGKWHRYRLSTGTVKKEISRISVQIAHEESVKRLSSMEYEDVCINYIYPKNGKHIDIADERIFNGKMNNRRRRQFNLLKKRRGDDEKDSHELDKYPQLPIP